MPVAWKANLGMSNFLQISRFQPRKKSVTTHEGRSLESTMDWRSCWKGVWRWVVAVRKEMKKPIEGISERFWQWEAWDLPSMEGKFSSTRDMRGKPWILEEMDLEFDGIVTMVTFTCWWESFWETYQWKSVTVRHEREDDNMRVWWRSHWWFLDLKRKRKRTVQILAPFIWKYVEYIYLFKYAGKGLGCTVNNTVDFLFSTI